MWLPLLLGKNEMTASKVKIEFVYDMINIHEQAKKIFFTFSGHYYIPIRGASQIIKCSNFSEFKMEK